MNKNTILGLTFIFLILIGYSWYISPSEEDVKRQQLEIMKQDSLRQVQIKKAAISDSILKSQEAQSQNATLAIDSQGVANSTDLDEMRMRKYGVFAGVSFGEEKIYTIENEKLKLKFSSKGGGLIYAEVKDYRTYDTLPLILFDQKTVGFDYLLSDKGVTSGELYFEPIAKAGGVLKDSVYIKGEETYRLAFRIYPNNDKGELMKNNYLELEYIIKGDNYMIDYQLNMQNMADYVAPGLNDIPLNFHLDMYSQEKDPKQEVKQTGIYYKYVDQDVDNLTETGMDEKENLETKVQWISFKQQFFSVALIAKNNFATAKISQLGDETHPNLKFLKKMKSEISIPLVSNTDIQSFPMNIYMGPNKYNILNKYNIELERQVPLGWGFFLLHWINRFAVIPVFDFLSGFNWNYGIIILVLTILLKIVLFPIAYKTYLSSAKMRVLKPEVDEIGGKFPKQEDAMKKQQAVMALYKKAGVNPMSGCIPMLLQMPILFALFKFFPAAIELRQQSFLWADDLSTYDAIYSWSAQIPLLSTFYGNHISLFTLLMTVSTIFYTRLNNQMMSSSQQLPGMQTMMYLMPIMFLGFFNNYSAGLSYYYFLANMMTFGQMYLMRRFVNENAIHAQLQENKKKPVKVSKFQQRLEEMAKQKGYNPKK